MTSTGNTANASSAAVSNGKPIRKSLHWLLNQQAIKGGKAVRLVRQQINWPVTLWLVAAFISLCLSVTVWFLIDRMAGLFVATWVPSILAFGTLVRRR
jgi:hypothetical protein